MAYSEAQKKATLKYRDKAYEQMNLQVKKGMKEQYKSQAAARGLSLNAYIVSLLEADRASLDAAAKPLTTPAPSDASSDQ